MQKALNDNMFMTAARLATCVYAVTGCPYGQPGSKFDNHILTRSLAASTAAPPVQPWASARTWMRRPGRLCTRGQHSDAGHLWTSEPEPRSVPGRACKEAPPQRNGCFLDGTESPPFQRLPSWTVWLGRLSRHQSRRARSGVQTPLRPDSCGCTAPQTPHSLQAGSSNHLMHGSLPPLCLQARCLSSLLTRPVSSPGGLHGRMDPSRCQAEDFSWKHCHLASMAAKREL